MLTNKCLVIIGGTTGMGKAASLACLEAGARLVVVGKDEEEVSHAGDWLGKRGWALAGDARNESLAQRAIERCLDQFGDFHGLYHVAGGSGRKSGDGPLHSLTREGWDFTMRLNLTSVMLSNQAAIRTFLRRKTSGSILNLSSVLAFSPSPEHFSTHAYATAKAAVIGFSRSIAAYYAPHNIRINVLAPALTNTPMARRAVENIDIQAFVQNKQALDGGRIGLAEDLNGLVTYFLSDQSRFTTGQVVSVDGGWQLSEGRDLNWTQNIDLPK